jgi:hypothetical protein
VLGRHAFARPASVVLWAAAALVVVLNVWLLAQIASA